jgi:hypothetical protein
MKKFLLMTAMVCTLSVGAMAGRIPVAPDDTSAKAQHVGECMAVWAAQTRLNATTGMAILALKDPALRSAGVKFLQDSQQNYATFAAASNQALAVLSGTSFTTDEIAKIVLAHFIAADRAFLIGDFATFGADLDATHGTLQVLATKAAKCQEFMDKLVGGKFTVRIPTDDFADY